jgi:hypothetical protein
MMAQGDNLGADDVYRYFAFDGVGGALARQALQTLGNGACGTRGESPEQRAEAARRCWGDPAFDQNPRDDGSLPDPSDSRTGPRPFRYMLKTSVWALNDDERLPSGSEAKPGGVHWRLLRGNAPEPYGRAGLNKEGIGVINFYFANVQPVWDGNHHWPGIAPFPHFEPGAFDESCRTRDARPAAERAATQAQEFNQPSTWVLLSKSGAQMRNPIGGASGAGSHAPALLNDEGRLNLSWASSTTLELEDDRASIGLGLSNGIHAVSRGQAYYHRPGNWAEMPNFFNPYWRARLASVYQGRDSFPWVQELVNQLPPNLRNAPQKVITH